MNEKIQKVIADGKELANKKSWLSKGYVDLLASINAQLENIPDMDENAMEYKIKEWTHTNPETGYDAKRTMTIHLIFRDDAYLQLSLNKQCPYTGTWSGDSLNNPSTATIRLFAAQLSDAFDFFAKEIEKRNMENKIAIDTIGNIIAKLQQ